MLSINPNDVSVLLYLLLRSALPARKLLEEPTEFVYLSLMESFETHNPEALKKLIKNDLVALLYQIATNEITTYPEEKFATYLRNRILRIFKNALQQDLISNPIYFSEINAKEDLQERFLFHTKEAENGRNGKKRSFTQGKTLKREQELAKIQEFHPGVLLFKKEKKLQQLNLL
jgi:hypothetical protein